MRIAISLCVLAFVPTALIAQSSGQYPTAIALVDRELYHGDDRAGFDLPAGENPSRYKFKVKGRPLYCEEITACEASIAAALVAPPADTSVSGGTGAQNKGGHKQEKKLRK